MHGLIKGIPFQFLIGRLGTLSKRRDPDTIKGFQFLIGRLGTMKQKKE